MNEEYDYKLENGVLTYKEYEMFKPKKETGMAIDLRFKKEWKKPMPASLLDAELDVLIAGYVFQHTNSNALTIHQTQLLSALLELKGKRAS